MSTSIKPKVGEFRGKVGGVTYDDAGLFETAARGLGHRPGRGERSSTWKVGTEIAVRIEGSVIRGQVWALSESRGYVWLALDDGRYVAAYTAQGSIHPHPHASKIGAFA